MYMDIHWIVSIYPHICTCRAAILQQLDLPLSKQTFAFVFCIFICRVVFVLFFVLVELVTELQQASFQTNFSSNPDLACLLRFLSWGSRLPFLRDHITISQYQYHITMSISILQYRYHITIPIQLVPNYHMIETSSTLIENNFSWIGVRTCPWRKL